MSAFCEHLDGYRVKFVRAETAYRELNACMDRILDEGPDEERLDLVERALVEWLAEVHDLRKRFLTLVRQGDVCLPLAAGRSGEGPPGDGGVPAPGRRDAVCTFCGAVVPRLSWPEWDVNGRPRPAYRGAELSPPVSASLP